MLRCFIYLVLSAVGAITHPLLWLGLLFISAPDALNWSDLHNWVQFQMLNMGRGDILLGWGTFWIVYTFVYNHIMTRSGMLRFVVGGMFATAFGGATGGCFYTIGYFIASLILVLPLEIIMTFKCLGWLIRGCIPTAGRS